MVLAILTCCRKSGILETQIDFHDIALYDLNKTCDLTMYQMTSPHAYHVPFVSRTSVPYIVCLYFNVFPSFFLLLLQDMHYNFVDISRVL
jgi:hypothetical protein